MRETVKMIKEIFEKDWPDNKDILFTYRSTKYIDLIKRLSKDGNGWVFEFKTKDFETPYEKKQVEKLFSDYKENTKYYVYLNQIGHEIGVISVGYQHWNNLCGFWDIYVEPSFQNLGIGSELMSHAESLANEWHCRAMVLEVQSCNFPAIHFYLKNGFNFSGFDLINYSNDDVYKHEFRMEMSKLLK